MDVFRDLHPPGTLGPMLYRAGCPIFCPIQIAKTIESQKGIGSIIQPLMNNFSRRIHGRVLGEKNVVWNVVGLGIGPSKMSILLGIVSSETKITFTGLKYHNFG